MSNVQQILKDPTDFAAELVRAFGTEQSALNHFNEARNADEGFICAMPQAWCVAVATALGAFTD